MPTTRSAHDSTPYSPRRTRRMRTSAAALGLLLGLPTAALSASAATDQSGRPDDLVSSARVLHFRVQFSPFTVVDVPPAATQSGDYRPGDYTVFSDVLTDRRGRRLGTEGGSGLITHVSKTGVQIYYSMAVRLRGGQIAVQGLGSPAPDKHLAIVGGTHRFLGARGGLHLVEHRDGTGTLTLTLRR